MGDAHRVTQLVITATDVAVTYVDRDDVEVEVVVPINDD